MRRKQRKPELAGFNALSAQAARKTCIEMKPFDLSPSRNVKMKHRNFLSRQGLQINWQARSICRVLPGLNERPICTKPSPSMSTFSFTTKPKLQYRYRRGRYCFSEGVRESAPIYGDREMTSRLPIYPSLRRIIARELQGANYLGERFRLASMREPGQNQCSRAHLLQIYSADSYIIWSWVRPAVLSATSMTSPLLALAYRA